MIDFYKFKLWKNHKKKLIFYSKDNFHSRFEISKKEDSHKNFQKIKFNQKYQFTIKKRFTLDWHIRPHKNLMLDKISKNKKLLKLASFYSQLNSSDFSKKFTSLMIFNPNIQTQQFKNIKQQKFNDTRIVFPSKIRKFTNFTETALEQNKKIFSNLGYKDKVWFSKFFLPFSNRKFWWVLLPTQSILTHMRWKIFLKRITNLFQLFQRSTSDNFHSTILFDFSPEFLIEKPIYWYWMLPFFGSIGLMSNNINFSFFDNLYSTYTLQNKVYFNIYSPFSQYQIQNNLSWEMFQFFDYKKILFDSSLKYVNHLSLNHNNFSMQIKKTWLSRQKEHYICNYEDHLIQTDLNKNLNQLTKLVMIYWWKKNWKEITCPKYLFQLNSNSIEIENASLLNFKQNKYSIENSIFNIKKDTQFYSFDSLFYSKFYWYWYNLDTKNINLNLNYLKMISKNHLINNSKFNFQEMLSNYNPILHHSLFNSKLVNNFLFDIPMCFRSSSNDFFSINEFPLKLQFPWLFYDLQNNKIKQKINNKINDNFDSITAIIENNLKNIEINVGSQKNNNNQYKKNLFQIRKCNLTFKKTFDCNFIKINNSIFFKDILFPSFFLNFQNVSRSSFLFCVSSKNQSTMKLNGIIKKSFQLIKQEKPIYSSLTCNYKNKKSSNYINLLLQNKYKFFLQLTLYNSIGCEIFESELNPIYQWSQINFKNIKPSINEAKTKNSQINNNSNQTWIKKNLKKNQAISSFHKASFLLDNLKSKFYFESGITWLTTQNFINYFYQILNIKQFYNNNKISLSNYNKIIKINKNPILMSGYNLPHVHSILQEKKKIFKELSNRIKINEISVALSPNRFSNQTKIHSFLNYNQKKYIKSDFHKMLNLNCGGSYLSLIKKQNLCIFKKNYRLINSKHKEKKFERFLILNLLQNYQQFFSQSRRLEKNFKKMTYRKQFFNSKYKTIKPILLINNQFNNQILGLQKKIFKIKENKIRINRTNNKEHTTLMLLNYADSRIKKKMDSISREFLFFTQPQKTLFSSVVLSNPRLSILKMKQKKIFNSLNFNNIPKYHYVSNKSIFWNYINSNYSSGLLNITQPFIFDKCNDFIKNTRIDLVNKNTQNMQNWQFFSNFLLKKYQRKNKNWPGGANPQGFFYKRINKLNFKQIQKKQNVERIEGDNEIRNILNIESKQFKKVSELKPVAELLWEVRTKHKIPEVLLIQQTLFFQKKLVRKSTEENNFVNQYSSANEGLSQKVQTLLRKMTQRRHFRKHVFLETLFHWTRDAISLRKMLRKIYFKNDWQIFLKYILKSKKKLTSVDYYSNWYKKNRDNDKNFVKKKLLSNSFNITFNKNLNKILKTENIRPFFYKLIPIEKNTKLFLSKKNINFILKDFSKNILIDFTLLKTLINNQYFYNFKKKKITFNNKLQTVNFVSLRELNSFSHFRSNNLLVFPEWEVFNYFPLPNILIQKQFRNLRKKRDNINFKSPLNVINENSLNTFIKKNQLSNINNYFNYLFNEINSYYFINQKNLSKITFPLYNTKNKKHVFNINKKLYNDEKIHDHLVSSFRISFDKNLLLNINKENHYHSEIKQQSKQLNCFFKLNLFNNFNVSRYYKILRFKNSNKFFEINKKYDFLQTKLLEKNPHNSLFNYYSNKLSIRNHLFFQKLYFTNIFWHSIDFILNTNSTIFTQNELIQNVKKQNWIFQIRRIDSQQLNEKKFNLNFHNLLATLSTWQYKFQIRRDLLLQIFYIYFDHIGAFLNYIINNLILNNILNQIKNWHFFEEIIFLIKKEPIQQNQFLFNLKNDLIIQPTWSIELLNHIKTQYPHLYNQIQIKNQSNFANIQSNQKVSNILLKTPEFDSKKQIMFSSNFKTQLSLIDSFRRNSGKKAGKNYNIVSNFYTNSIFIDQSIIHKLLSQSLIIQNSTIFCQKWIQNKQFSNFYKIKFLKKQQKLKQILNILKNDENKQNYITNFYKDKVHLNFKRKHSLKKERTTMNFKRHAGFLFNRSLTTTNFNNFSSFSKVTRGSMSVYLNKNLNNSLPNYLFLIQLLLLHVCLIFCLITIYQSAFHFCLKSFLSIFVILIHYFLNIRYRLKRLIKYVYQSIAQSFITNIQEYFYSFNSIHNKLFVFFNNLSTFIFSKKFSIWGKIYKSSIPSLTNFLFKNPFSTNFIFQQIKFLKSKNLVKPENQAILPEKVQIISNLQSFFDNIEQTQIQNQNELTLNFKFDLISKRNLLKIISQQKVNNRMSLLRNTNVIKKDDFNQLQKAHFLISNQTIPIKSAYPFIFWEKEDSNTNHFLKRLIKKEKRTNIKNNNFSTFQLNLRLLKWNLGLILLIGESEIFAELEPYREMHWYFLKRLPIFLRSNTYADDPINMYDYQADEKLRKFKEQFKKATELFQKRQNTIERKIERNRKKEHVHNEMKRNNSKVTNNSEILNFELINKKYPNNKKNPNLENIILFIKSEKQFQKNSITVSDVKNINKITYLLSNFDFFRKKVSRGQPFWKPLFSFLAHTFFISRLSKLNRRFRDSVLIINSIWIPFGPLTAILCSFLWKNWILNFSDLLNNQNHLLNQLQQSTKKSKMINHSLFSLIPLSQNVHFKQNNQIINLNNLKLSEILQTQRQINENNHLKTISSYCSPFQTAGFFSNEINHFESEQFLQEIQKIWENINFQNNKFSLQSPPLLNRIFLWNFVKFEKKYQRSILKWMNIKDDKKNQVRLDFLKFSYNKRYLIHSNISKESNYLINKYKSIYINNQEQSAQNRYIHYKTYDPKVRLYRFYTNFSKNLHDIGIIQDAKNVHPLFGSLLCELYSGLFLSETKKRKQFVDHNIFPKQFSFFSSTKNILLIGNTNSSNFVLLVQAFAAETGLKLFMEDAKRLRRLGRRGINKSTKRLEKLFEIAQAHSPSIVFLEDIDVIGSKRRVIKINEEEEDDDMAIRSFFSKLIYRKQHNYKSLRQSFIHQNLFISNQDVYRNMQKSIIPESPIPSNLIKYQLTRRKAFSNYFSNTSNSCYKSFITKFNILKKVSSIDGNFSNNISSSPTNTVIIWKLLKSKLVTPKKTIKETPWKHIPIDSMRSIPLITYSIRVKVAKLTMLAIYTMNTQLRLVKDLIKLLEKIQYESYKGFIVFATTNKLSILDPSLRRPGRFDETVYLPSLTVNPNCQRAGTIHFLNVLSIDSQNFVNFSRTFNIINSANFAINWNVNSIYGNVFIQDNSEKIFYPTRTSLRDLINSTADNVYNQNIFMQNENNIYQNFISFDILGNIGFQKSSFSIYSKSVLLLSLAYSKAGQLIIKLFFQKELNANCFKLNNSKQLAFNSENNEFTIWPNSHIFSQFKKINISYINRHKNIKNLLIYYFAGKIGEFCFFSFHKNIQNKGTQKNKSNIEIEKEKKFNHFFEKNSFGLRSLYGIQPNWKNINSVIFFLIRTSCFYSKNHLTSKLLYLDDISKKRQQNFSENFGPSLLFEYFNVNTESFLKRNIIPLEEQLQKQQMQKYLLNLQKKPLRKFLFDSTSMKISKNYSYLNKIYSKNNSITEINKKQTNQSTRLALFRILFNELGSLDLIALRPTAMNYYYDKKIYYKQRFRKYTYKWWNWHLKRTIDSLEEFQYLEFFPYTDKQYNPRRQRWMLTNGYSAYWLAQEKILYYQIYEQLIIECFQNSYLHLNKQREMLDYLVQLLITKQLLTEIQWILFFKRFV